jgi:hypothetical protein
VPFSSELSFLVSGDNNFKQVFIFGRCGDSDLILFTFFHLILKSYFITFFYLRRVRQAIKKLVQAAVRMVRYFKAVGLVFFRYKFFIFSKLDLSKKRKCLQRVKRVIFSDLDALSVSDKRMLLVYSLRAPFKIIFVSNGKFIISNKKVKKSL